MAAITIQYSIVDTALWYWQASVAFLESGWTTLSNWGSKEKLPTEQQHYAALNNPCVPKNDDFGICGSTQDWKSGMDLQL
jgi:hypothetical protein